MGPIAPKDPVKKRDFFYIMLEKQISAAPAPENRGVCYIYENDGRMISSSRMVGNVTDESMLDMMKTAEGFRKLVYGIGVSMMQNDGVDADFVFQMYGKRDTYGSGTVIKQHITADGVEYLIPFNEVEWSDDDLEPGQIRFEFPKSGILSSVNVRFYLNDGFKAPEFEGLDPVDTNSTAYKKMIDRSLIHVGNTGRLERVIKRAQNGEEITLAYIGGSITQGAGATPIYSECYTRKMFEAFNEKYSSKHNAKYIKAGVGGTPSELGMIRYERDVLEEAGKIPDVVVVEFAVNDNGDETGGDCYEGLVRRLLTESPKTAVILLFSVFADDSNLEERLVPIGKHYNLPMVSVKSAVTAQFYLSKAEGRILAKNRFFYDCYHPTNLGHTIMADCLMKLVNHAAQSNTEEQEAVPEALRSDDFTFVRLLDLKDNPCNAVLELGSFDKKDTEIQCVERNMDAFTTPQFPNNMMHDKTGTEELRLKLTCKSLLIVTKDSASPEAGKADIYVDDKFVKTVDPNEIGWTHCNAQVIIRSKAGTSHDVVVKMHSGDEEKKFTVLGFGVVL